MQGRWIIAVALLAVALGRPAAAQSTPEGYPANYKGVVADGTKEGKVVVYSSTDAASAEPLLKGFRAAFPGVEVEYNDLNTSEIYSRFISETAANAGSGDVLWSSAMDLQMKLVGDGYALGYKSPEAGKLPGWAVFKDLAYGTTLEPVVFAYNKRLLPADQVPKTHDDFTRIVTSNKQKFAGKVTTYDPEKSGLGFLFVTQDAKLDKNFWDLAKALGGGAGRFYTSSGAMMEKISSGEHVLGYDMIGSYVVLRKKKDTDLEMVFPQDYTLGFSRIAFIPKAAKHPNAAKLFLDYMLSQKGQTILANEADLYAVREDVQGESTAGALKKQLGDKLKPIAVGTNLLEYFDPKKRLDFLKHWQQTARAQ
jgi:iron(III) transport system substrate-binding protein